VSVRITVFGASGGIGGKFVELAAERGHAIRAVYRTAPPVPPTGEVEILVDTDIFDPDLVARAIRGADVVVTALGPNFARRHDALARMVSAPDIHQRLARTLVSVMRDSGASARVIAVSTGSMGPGDAAMGLGPRLLLGLFRNVVARNLKVVGRDLAAMEKELAGSGLDWYAVRPTKLTDGPLTKRVQASERFAMKDISRADVAWYLLAVAEDRWPRYRTPMLVSGHGRPAELSETRLAGGQAS
jgi:nucleoside-diphosphate-sugar epimerase